MKKIIAVLFNVFLLITLSSCKNENSSDKSSDNPFNGKVKTVTQKAYEAEEKFGEVVPGKPDINMGPDWISFNENGNIIELKYFDSETNELIRKENYIYDKSGNLVERENDGKEDRFKYKWVLKYNSEDQLVEELKLLNDGTKERKTVYKYDENGNIIEEKTFHTNLTKKGPYYTFKYNDDNQLIEKNSFSPDGTKDGRTTHHYVKGKLKEIKSYNEDGLWFKYSLNENEDLIKEISYESDETISFENDYKYEYDQNDNWIKRTAYMTSGKYIQNQPTSITTREIEYY
ncbi:hypothetical protein [uncultured Christiangramia sp.]|uniref:hypothetical protein n=1 Tax=uncultured Christiangramia sp. TaxID=503836 RepID=UPI00262F4F1C|nr:hypothetical protein [uncultured Christiangramia sp.]